MTIDSTSLFIGLIFGSIGFGYFLYGKRQKHKTAFWAGIGLMIYPYFIEGTVPLIAIGLLLMAAPRLLPSFD
ncbi:hypothetical protein ACQUQU_10810 [Thalassolituus sp. LLYu03]|uniref:hypothetical protein n=1 Tax=Thalassolituus sp. LLYu03 TaxID=3421656 RepID=UPI003D2E3367